MNRNEQDQSEKRVNRNVEKIEAKTNISET